MIEVRVMLLQALERVSRGEPFAGPEFAVVAAKGRGLTGVDLRAYTVLAHWADDADIRAKDPAYAVHQKRQVDEALTHLARSLSIEDEDHPA